MGKFIEDFKAFALKGNVIDMAIGVIVGGAFGKIVSSLVDDILMPLITCITGGLDYKDMKWVLKEGHEAGANGVAAVQEIAVNYGTFIMNIIDFFIIALSIFIAIRYTMKFMNKVRKDEAEAAAAPAEPSAEEKLLTEIRDLLKEQKK